MRDGGNSGRCSPSGLLTLLCAALLLLAGFAQVNHVHSDRSSSSHECSLCSVAHSGAVNVAAYQVSPALFSSPLAPCPHGSPDPLLLATFLYSRPPPSV